MNQSIIIAADPKKKLYKPLLWLVVLTLGLLLPVIAGSAFLRVKPWQSSLHLEYPRNFQKSADGSFLVSDRGERRILGMDAAGNLRFIIRGERRSRGFYNGRLLGTDSRGNFYVDDTLYELETGNVEARRIVRFSQDGRYLDTLLNFSYSGDQMFAWDIHPVFAQLNGNTLYWFKPDDTGQWSLLILDLDASTQVRSIPLPGVAVYDMLAAVVLSPSELYFLRSDGAIDRWRFGEGLTSYFESSPTETGQRIRFPTAMVAAPEGWLLVADSKSMLYRLKLDQTAVQLEQFFDGHLQSSESADDRLFFQSVSVSMDGDVLFADEATGRMVSLNRDGSVVILEGARFGSLFRLVHLGVWLALCLGLLSGLVVVSIFYIGMLKRRTPVVLKQLFIMVPVVAIMVASVAIYVYQTMASTMNEQQRDRLLHLSHNGAAAISADAVKALDFSTMSFQELLEHPACHSLVKVMDELVNRNTDPWNSSIYPYLYIKQAGLWWILGSFDYIEPYPYERPEFDAVELDGQYTFLRYSDVYGSWLSALSPVLAEDGHAVAVFEVSMSADFMDEAGRAFARRAAIGGAGILAVFLAMLGGFTYMLLKSIKKLQRGVERVSSGDYDIRVQIASRDELEDLGNAFNGMSAEIRNYIESLARFNRAYGRFVPKEFLERLGKNSITEVRLGNQVKMDMTVMFSDIRDFTTISERIGPTETIALLNDYLSRMGPLIRAQNGFIDKYIGDAIMALFPERVEDAVAAILDMMDALDVFRIEMAKQGKDVTDSGFAIHTGSLMLGIIGEAERYEGTVIADTVNLAARLESLTKYYGVRALLSGVSVRRLASRRQPLRFLDAVQVKGKTQAVLLYELVGRGDPLRDVKLGQAATYKAAYRHYAKAEFEQAVTVFERYLAATPGDRPAQILLERSLRYLTSGAPDNWQGITIFHDK